MKKRNFLALLLALSMMLSLAACGSSSSSSSTSEDSSETTTEEAATAETTETEAEAEVAATSTYTTVKIGSTAARTVGHFDVIGVLSDNYACPAIYLCFDPLIYCTDGVYQSDILSDYYWDETLGENGGTVLVLRDDVYFASGDQMTAEDVIYSINRTGSTSRNATSFARLDMDSLTISDDGLTISIPWNEVYGGWEHQLSSVIVYNESWIEENGGDDFDYTDPTLIDGSGPYIVTEVVEDVSTTYEKREGWWMEDEADGLASVQTIEVYYYADSTTMMVDYENGVIDVALNLTDTDYDYVAADSALGSAVAFSTNCVVTMVLDNENCEALADENLRLAIAYAVNREELTILGYGSLGVVASGYLATTNQYFVDGLTYEYDPELAAQIVEENGLEGTTITFVCPSGLQATMGEALQAQLAAVGINLDLQVYDQATCISMWIEGTTNLMFDQTSTSNLGNLTNNQFINLRYTNDFPCFAKTDDTWNTLLNDAVSTTDTALQAELYAEFQQYAYDLCCTIPICEWMQAYCYGASGVVADMTMNDVTGPNLRDITLN